MKKCLKGFAVAFLVITFICAFSALSFSAEVNAADKSTKNAEKPGWHKVSSKKYYYVKKSGKRAKKGWLTVKGKKYYINKSGYRSKGFKKIGKKYYYFDNKGVQLKKSTLKKFLKTGLKPVGQTLYVWGGGWNKEDTGAGKEAVTLGISSKWKKFYDKNDADYDYNQTRYQIHDGLDCSGYVGWTVYNTFNTSNGNEGYVMEEEETAAYAKKGWGKYAKAGSFTDFKAGDIMSSSDHVYIVLGQCKDSSVVLLHSSPPGVVICGTCTPDGDENSEAAALAKKYMKKYYPDWYSRYGTITKGTYYLNSFSRMRWKTKGACMMTDPDDYANKYADQILKDLLGPI